ncbi:MAG: cobaltochelatase subunit CobN [Acidobacteriota bacterium]
MPLLSPGPLAAAELFGIVSERNAAEMAAAAAAFDAEHPGHTLILRDPEQLRTMTDRQLEERWRSADVVLVGGIFGDPVPRLVEMAEASPTPMIALSSDRRLVRLSKLRSGRLFAGVGETELGELISNPSGDESFEEHLARLLESHPEQAPWTLAWADWRGRGSEHFANLISRLLAPFEKSLRPRRPAGEANVRYYRQRRVRPPDALELGGRPTVVVLDLDTGDRLGDRDLLDRLEKALEARGLATVAVLARWGEATVEAIDSLESRLGDSPLVAILSLQDFVMGGGQGRERVARRLEELNVPVIHGIRMLERTPEQWRLSSDGIPWDAVHYRVAMPELQGASQPMILALGEKARVDALTGIRVQVTRPEEQMVELAAARLAKWRALREKAEAEKKVAIVYYNHPPGRHNIGADNLDVPASLWEILQRLRAEGYATGELPESPEALLDRLQEAGVYLPEDRSALAERGDEGAGMAAAEYRRWFQTLPETVRREVSQGPLGRLHGTLRQAVLGNELKMATEALDQVSAEIHHILEGADHPARGRALDLFDQLEAAYRKALAGEDAWSEAEPLIEAVEGTGIEGLRGWGEPPGRVMVAADRLHFPGLTFGNIFIGPQPPRGWELDEELLHANTTFPPTHHYLAFYRWLHRDFAADAVIHLGRHSTYEFLPRRRVGLTPDDYPLLIAGDVPGIYPYIVDGVGEGIQAKRRGLAVMVDHLTPPLQTTPLYEDLLELRQLVESFEAAEASENSPILQKSIAKIRQKVDALEIRQDLEEELAAEHHLGNVSLDQVDDDLLVHEVGHYLTELQERFLPMGLHVFGRPWSAEAVRMMLGSMAGDGELPAAARAALESSPGAEMASLMRALDGGFVAPGKGNDPIRAPEALPTGRNFYAIDGSLVPSKIAHELGVELAGRAERDQAALLERDPDEEGREEASVNVILWASDTVRDEGVMVAFGLELLGVKPVWNSRGILQSIERKPLAEKPRQDVVFTTSGLFRDLYANLLVWLDRAVLLALSGAEHTIVRQHPELQEALESALAPLGDLRAPGSESLDENRVAWHWVRKMRAALEEEGAKPADLGRIAALRIFGDAPGAYGAGVNRLVERSGAWQDRSEVAEAFLGRMGHGYGVGFEGAPAHASHAQSLAGVGRTYHGRATNLYGLLDNNDAFDYLGGSSLAIEHLTGRAPSSFVIDHANPDQPRMSPLRRALVQELRGEPLNPEYLRAMMQHGYAGARTLGSEFVENLWGWQVTNPQIVEDWIWREVKSVYIDDAYGIELDDFLGEGHNAHVKANILAVLLVAVHKGFWEADAETVRQLATELAELLVENGLPGSGHTRPDHPMLEWLEGKIPAELAADLKRVREAALGDPAEDSASPTTVAEIEPVLRRASPYLAIGVVAVLLGLFLVGLRRGSS